MTCSSCAAELVTDARFCSRCGAAVTAAWRGVEERRVVTVLFCDLAGSTELSGVLDPELLRSLLLRYYELMTGVITASSGVVEKFIGDAVMAVFGLTETREDDARRALVAALGMVAAMSRLDTEVHREHGVHLRVRIGVHTGEVVAIPDPSERQAFVSGEVVNIAARLEAAAPAGGVLLSAATRFAAGAALTVAERQWRQLKGVAEPVETFRLVDVPPPDPARMRRFDVPFVGREPELTALDAAWRQVVDGAAARVLTVLGEPGIGKTRLVAEWLRRRGGAVGRVSVGRCRPNGDGGSLTALAECIAPLADEAQQRRDAPAVGSALALLRQGLLHDGTPAPSLDETGAAVTRLVAAVAAARPLPLVIDDWHWAQPSMVTVLQRLLAGLGGLPVLFVCVARPDLVDARPGWGTGAGTALVGDLSAAESAQLAACFAEVAPQTEAVTRRIAEQAGGNPLYLEQLAGAVHQDGATVDQLPLTLHALVASRIDQMGNEERAVLRFGALVDPDGNGFGREDVSALAGGRDCGPALLALLRRRFLEPVDGSRYRIVSGITRQVAYGGLTKRRRGELHERYANQLAAGPAPDALVGRHLATAHHYHSVVGTGGERAAALRQRACRHLAKAGTEALRRMDLPWALALLEQAGALAEAGDPGRAQCLQQLGEVQLTLGRHDQARPTLTLAAAEAAAGGHLAAAAHARLHLAMLEPDVAGLHRVAAEELPVFAAHHDDLGLARVRYILARSYQRRGHHEQALEVLEQALAHSLAAGADREVANTLGAVGLSLWHGPTPAAEAAARCHTLLDGQRDRDAVRATLGFALTVLYAIQARADLAAVALADAQQAMAALSYAESRFFQHYLGALVATSRGDDGQAAALLADAVAAATTLGAQPLARQARLELARVHLAHGDVQAAGALLAGLDVGEDDPADLVALLGLTARVQAGASRGPGDGERALQAARRAVLAARRTDSPAGQGRALLDLAHTHASLGRQRPATLAASAAARRFHAKGHEVGQAQARRLVAELGERAGRAGGHRRWG